MKTLFTFLILASSAFSLATATATFAGELDNTVGAAPQGLVVRVDASGNREMFKADMTTKVTDEATAADTNTRFVKNENRIAKVAPASELDRSTSTEAWYYWYAPSYMGSYYYSYWSSSYRYTYYPCYNWYARGYSYYYYYWY